jgi:hypothetical protein
MMTVIETRTKAHIEPSRRTGLPVVHTTTAIRYEADRDGCDMGEYLVIYRYHDDILVRIEDGPFGRVGARELWATLS